MGRNLLLPRDATNDGSRRLRELLRARTFAAIARRLLCDETAVHRWATERAKPGRVLRARAWDRYGIPEGAWDEEPPADPYLADDPATARRPKP